jgi:heat shock protein HslJ
VPGVSKPSSRRWLWPALAALALVAVLWGLTRNRRPAPVEQTVGAVRDTVADVTEPTGEKTAASDVVDVVWEWVSMTTPVEELKADSPDRYTLRLGSDGHLALKADCNRGSGAYTITGDRALTMKPIALTRAMCPQGSLSDRFARDVGRATSYFIKDGDLYLELPVDSGTLRFKRQG